MLPDIIKSHGGSLSAELVDTLTHAAGLADQAVSDRTRTLYQAEFSSFATWGAGHALPTMPTSAAVVATYLAHLQRQGRALSSANLVRAAIRWKHAQARHTLDLNSADVRNVMKGFRRELSKQGRKVDKASPFTVVMWVKLAEIAGTDLEGLRDVALIGLGIVRALRGPSELLGLDLTVAKSPGALGSLEITSAGARIVLGKTKTHQHDGEALDIETGPALEAVKTWINAAGILPGTPIWRTIRHGCVMDYRMKQRTLHNVIQRRAELVLRELGATAADAAAKAQDYSTHSMRHGALTSLGQAGASLTEIMSLSRHSASSAKIAMGYVKPENVGPKAMKKLGM